MRVIALDANGVPIEEEWGWVFGDIPADGRAFFAVPIVYPSSNFTVTIGSFDVVTRRER